MANVVSALRDRMFESRGMPGRLSGHAFLVKWGAVVLLVLLAIATAIVVSTLRHDVAAKQADASNTPNTHATEPSLAPVTNPKTSAAKTEVQSSSHSVTTHVTNSNDGTKGTTSVTVNGQNVPVPESGNVHKVVTDGNGNTAEVNISTNSDQSGSSADSSVNVNVSSEQSTSIDNSQ